MTFDYRARLKKLKLELKKISIDSLLVSDETNVTYLSGFEGNDSALVITPDSQFFLTDSRYTEEAKDSAKEFAVVEVRSSTYDTIGEIARKDSLKKLGFESMNLPFGVAENLRHQIGRTKLVPSKNIVEKIRAIKDQEEIARIKSSISVAKAVLKNLIETIRPGVSELSLSDRVECEFIKRGARVSFQTIIACGKNCSKPHAHPTCDRVAKDDCLMIDIGCKLNLYNSDMTRIVLLGRVKDKIKEMYQIVSTAQKKAIDKIAPGRKISEIDSAGRSYIAEKGYGKFFGHSLGHGIGLDVHEEPSVSERNSGRLKQGMVFTVEPAIYLPKFGGVRIEDMVLVTDRGCEILTR